MDSDVKMLNRQLIEHDESSFALLAASVPNSESLGGFYDSFLDCSDDEFAAFGDASA